ncbi:hypothetical protein PHIN6_01890 [Polynucleobacter sp. HIN6]|nr:hypothetical protein PHIN6_01890 [Polynucleobacter sp. HIN6]BEI36466.1 hypothetical protein PHIN7_01900 [Polynucleobacter sp. HIN7]BEI43816.1 hypothetical protein PHIN11_01880 [Polynucleobacter sp. HIN11]
MDSVSTANLKIVVCDTEKGIKYFLLGGFKGMGVSPSLNTVGANGSVPSAKGSEKQALSTVTDDASKRN